MIISENKYGIHVKQLDTDHSESIRFTSPRANTYNLLSVQMLKYAKQWQFVWVEGTEIYCVFSKDYKSINRERKRHFNDIAQHSKVVL